MAKKQKPTKPKSVKIPKSMYKRAPQEVEAESMDRDVSRLVSDHIVAVTPKQWNLMRKLQEGNHQLMDIRVQYHAYMDYVASLFQALASSLIAEHPELHRHADPIIQLEPKKNGYLCLTYKSEFDKQQQEITLNEIPKQFKDFLRSQGWSDAKIAAFIRYMDNQ